MGGLKIVALELQWNLLFAWTAVGSVCMFKWQRLPKGQEWRHFNKQIGGSDALEEEVDGKMFTMQLCLEMSIKEMLFAPFLIVK